MVSIKRQASWGGPGINRGVNQKQDSLAGPGILSGVDEKAD